MQVDETHFRAPASGVRDRRLGLGRSLALLPAKEAGAATKRTRLHRVVHPTADSLEAVVLQAVAPGYPDFYLGENPSFDSGTGLLGRVMSCSGNGSSRS